MNKFITYVTVSLKDTLVYRGDVALYTGSGVVFTLITLILWLNTNTGSPQFYIQYYFFLLLVGLICSSWNSIFISRDIRFGRISPFLVKPIPYIIHQAGNNIGEKLVKLVFLIPILLALGLFFRFTFPVVAPVVWLAFVISVLFAAVINFILEFIVGITAFWLDDSEALREIYGVTSLAFSGRFVPLVVLPLFFRKLAAFLPFRYSLSLPLEIITKELPVDQLFPLLVIQFGVLLAVIFLCRLLWQWGLVRYTASGN